MSQETLLGEARLAARECFGLKGAEITPLPGGRVNDTFLAEAGGRRYALQRLNDIYEGCPSLGLNWRAAAEAVAARAHAGECLMPAIFPGLGGDLTPQLPGHVGLWRLTAFIEGRSGGCGAADGQEAGRLLGRLHTLLNTPAPIGIDPLSGVELTNYALTSAADFEALNGWYKGHPNLGAVKAAIARGAALAADLPRDPHFLSVFRLHDVVTHGDPKAGNFIFGPDGRAVALLDWDDLAYGHVLSDVAEMLRSWGQGSPPAEGEAAMAAVVRGYAATGLPLAEDEVALLPALVRSLALTLARRYLTDALAETFFKWDGTRYPSLHEQNRQRAESLLGFCESALEDEARLAGLFLKAYQDGLAGGAE